MEITEVIYYGFESELLEAHIAEHRPHVKRIIVAESSITTTGYPKPLFFQENKKRYEKYDVEHVVIPPLNTPVVSDKEQEWGTQFRIRDSAKRLYMHPIASKGADWVFHNDTDEIVKPEAWPLIQESLSSPEKKNWVAGQLYPTLLFCHVNVVGKWREKWNWRWYRAGAGDHIKNELKGKPRGPIITTSGAWHLHNCYSSPEDLYWAAWNRLEWWDGPKNVPDMDFWRLIHSSRGQVYKIKETSRRMEIVNGLLIFDDPARIAKESIAIITLDKLPKYVQDNIHKFPVYNG